MSKVEKKATELMIGFENGETADGEVKVAHTTFKNINSEISNDDLFEVGTQLVELQKRTLFDIVRVNKESLVAEG